MSSCTVGIYKRFFKRALDFSTSIIGLVILSPVLLVVATLVKIKLGSPVLFTQQRAGINEGIFKIYKFRTMTDARNENGELLPDVYRVTKFGKFLRSTSLDELPELLNILKGDMSIIGPRPLLIRYLPFYREEERLRSSVRPGITGLAQVTGRNALSWDERFKTDVYYVTNISFLLDVKILIATTKVVFKRENILVGSEHVLEDLDISRKKEFGPWN